MTKCGTYKYLYIPKSRIYIQIYVYIQINESGPITSWQIDGEKMETVTEFIFLGSRITVDIDYSHKIKTLAHWKKSYDKPRQHIKKQRHHFAGKGPCSQSYGFPTSHVWI